MLQSLQISQVHVHVGTKDVHYVSNGWGVWFFIPFLALSSWAMVFYTVFGFIFLSDVSNGFYAYFLAIFSDVAEGSMGGMVFYAVFGFVFLSDVW